MYIGPGAKLVMLGCYIGILGYRKLYIPKEEPGKKFSPIFLLPIEKL
jgi:hypothetical protein